jgi:hypothetical protein
MRPAGRRPSISADATIVAIRDRILALEHSIGADRQELRRLRTDHDRLVRDVASMSKADEIAAAVTDAIGADRRARYTLGRKVVAVTAAAILLVPALHDLFVWIGG